MANVNEVITNVKQEEKPIYLAKAGNIPVAGSEYRCAKIVHNVPERSFEAVYIDCLERVEHLQDGIYKFEAQGATYYVSVADVIKSSTAPKTIYLAKAGKNTLEAGQKYNCAKIVHNAGTRLLEAICIDCEFIEHVGGSVYKVEASDGIYYVATNPNKV